MDGDNVRSDGGKPPETFEDEEIIVAELVAATVSPGRQPVPDKADLPGFGGPPNMVAAGGAPHHAPGRSWIAFGRLGWIVGGLVIPLSIASAVLALRSRAVAAEDWWYFCAAAVGLVFSIVGVCRPRQEGPAHGIVGIFMNLLALAVALAAIGIVRAQAVTWPQTAQRKAPHRTGGTPRRPMRDKPAAPELPSDTAEWDLPLEPTIDRARPGADSAPVMGSLPRRRVLEMPGRARPDYPLPLKASAVTFAGVPSERSLITETSFKQVPRKRLSVTPKEVLPSPLFSADGLQMYLLTAGGQLWKISLPDFVVTREVELGAGCISLTWSARQLVAARRDGDLLIVLDPETLDGQGWEIPGGVSNCAGSPGTSRVFLPYPGDRTAERSRGYIPPPDDGASVKILDLSRKQILQEIRGDELTVEMSNRYPPGKNPAIAFGHPLVSPDGRYLYTFGGDAVHRFAIREGGIEYEDSGPSFHGPYSGIPPELLGSQLARLARSQSTANHPVVERGYYIYSPEEQRRPVLTFTIPEYPVSVVRDEAAGRYYVLDVAGGLNIVSAAGGRLARLNLFVHSFSSDGYFDGNEPRLLACPLPGHVLAQTDRCFLWLEIPSPETDLPDIVTGNGFAYPLTPLSIPGEACDEAGTVVTERHGSVTVREVAYRQKGTDAVAWSPAGDRVYLLLAAKRLCAVDPQTLRIQRSVELPPCESPRLSVAADGIVVFDKGRGAIYTAAADSLDVRAEIRIPFAADVATSPASPYAFVPTRDGYYQFVRLSSGELVQQFSRALPEATLYQIVGDKWWRDGGYHGSHFTADGKWVLCFQNGLHRFGVEDSRLRYDTSVPYNMEIYGGFYVSPDSHFVATNRVSAWDTAARRFFPQKGIALYEIADLSRPLRTIAGAFERVPIVVGCGGDVMTSASAGKDRFVCYDRDGEQPAPGELAGPPHSSPWKMFPHPTNPRLAAATYGSRYQIVQFDAGAEGP